MLTQAQEQQAQALGINISGWDWKKIASIIQFILQVLASESQQTGYSSPPAVAVGHHQLTEEEHRCYLMCAARAQAEGLSITMEHLSHHQDHQ